LQQLCQRAWRHCIPLPESCLCLHDSFFLCPCPISGPAAIGVSMSARPCCLRSGPSRASPAIRFRSKPHAISGNSLKMEQVQRSESIGRYGGIFPFHQTVPSQNTNSQPLRVSFAI
jgi:hypothetical protein